MPDIVVEDVVPAAVPAAVPVHNVPDVDLWMEDDDEDYGDMPDLVPIQH